MVSLQLQEILQDRGLTIEELSDISGIPEISIKDLIDKSFPITEENANILRMVSEALELPIPNLLRSVNDVNSIKIATTSLENKTNTVVSMEEIKLQIREFMNEKGLTFEDLSTLTGVPTEVIEPIITQPLDTTFFTKEFIKNTLCEYVCKLCRCCSC